MTNLLSGVRVLESVILLNGDTLGMHLADLGADVVKIESPGTGDYLRDILGQIEPRHSPAHLQVNKNKRSIALDLRAEGGLDVFWDLLRTADVFIDGFAGAATDKLGIGYDAQRQQKTNPDAQYDAVRAMTVSRVGERAAGIDNPGAEACIANYERYAAVDIPREGIESGEYSSILRTWDLFAVLLTGLIGAADDLTRENFITALENGGTVELVGSGDGSFTADDHSFIDEFRTIQWDAACPCWKAVSEFSPLR